MTNPQIKQQAREMAERCARLIDIRLNDTYAEDAELIIRELNLESLLEAKQRVEVLTSMFRHYHVNNGSNDVCKSCGLDLWDSVHIRITTPNKKQEGKE